MTNKLFFLALRKVWRKLDTRIGLLLCRQQVQRPIFIVGCGRSGTTILGRILQQHPKVTYLNERRDLWAACYPVTDIWSRKAKSRAGKMVLTSGDERCTASEKLRRLFMWQTIRSGRNVLVEKTPINIFRLAFLQEIFPDAFYIHILRNGIEVAKSIERTGSWYEKYGYRWSLLVEYAKKTEETSDLKNLCYTDYEKGLMEWRLSLDALYASRSILNTDHFIEITYDDLVQMPEQTISKLINFLGLPHDSNVFQFSLTNLSRRHSKAAGKLTEKEARIAGKCLQPWFG